MKKINFQNIKLPIPQIKDQKLSFDHQNIVELLFFFIIQKIHGKNNWMRLSEKFFNIVILYLIICIISSFFFIIPVILNPNSTTLFTFAINLLFLLFASISWAYFIYLSQDFKDLIQRKILPEIKHHRIFLKLLNQFLNGTYCEWGRLKFRVYMRSFFLLFPILGLLILTYRFLQTNFNFNINFESTLFLLNFLYNSFFGIFLAFLFIFIIITVVFIILFLFLFVMIIPITIKPYIEMGDTKKYGEIIVGCLYLIAFVLGIFPLNYLITHFNINELPISQLSIIPIQHQTVGNITFLIRQTVTESINEISFGRFTDFGGYILFFSILFFFCLSIILRIHYRISKKKQEEQNRLENSISSIDFSQNDVQIDNQINIQRDQYLLIQYEKIIALKEWPVHRTFPISIIISIFLLFISKII